MTLNWYDGALFPPSPEELGETRLNPTGGVIYFGSKGKLMHDTYGFNPQAVAAGAGRLSADASAETAAHPDEP